MARASLSRCARIGRGLMANSVSPEVISGGTCSSRSAAARAARTGAVFGPTRRAGPVVRLPDQDALDLLLPGLPQPGARLDRGVVDELRGERRLGDRADVPPEAVARPQSLPSLPRVERAGDRAPQVHDADQCV